MLRICFWKRKCSVLGSREAIFEPHSWLRGSKIVKRGSGNGHLQPEG
ncbi:MAG: hypothetical protein ACI81W_003339 [Saprospiraceae bacterium]|jgi:hypothetical protein